MQTPINTTAIATRLRAGEAQRIYAQAGSCIVVQEGSAAIACGPNSFGGASGEQTLCSGAAQFMRTTGWITLQAHTPVRALYQPPACTVTSAAALATAMRRLMALLARPFVTQNRRTGMTTENRA